MRILQIIVFPLFFCACIELRMTICQVSFAFRICSKLFLTTHAFYHLLLPLAGWLILNKAACFFMSDSLIINLTMLPEEGLRLDFSEGDEWFRKCFTKEELPDFSLEEANVNCLISRSGDTIYIRGTLSANIIQECDRCLELTTISIGEDFTYTLVPEKEETSEEMELFAEDLEKGYYHGDFIDLAPIVCEQIILQTPMKILCVENCRGLCPHCGTNLNKGKCDCRLFIPDSRLAALKDFKIKKT